MLLALLASILAQPGPRDGLYTSLALGPEIEIGSYRAGPGLLFDFAIGGGVLPDFALAFDVGLGVAFVKEDPGNSSAMLGRFGVLADYFVDGSSGWHIRALVGAGVRFLAGGGTNLATSSTIQYGPVGGPIVALGVGHSFEIAPDLGAGVIAGVESGYLWADRTRIVPLAFSLSATLTFF